MNPTATKATLERAYKLFFVVRTRRTHLVLDARVAENEHHRQQRLVRSVDLEYDNALHALKKEISAVGAFDYLNIDAAKLKHAFPAATSVF